MADENTAMALESDRESQESEIKEHQVSEDTLKRLDEHRKLLELFRQRKKRGKLRPYLPAYDQQGEQIYCYCRKPDDGNFMISCDLCSEWFHGTCVDIVEEDAEVVDTFICDNCKVTLERMLKEEPRTVDMPAQREQRIPAPPKKNPSVKEKSNIQSRSESIRAMARKNFFESVSAIFAEAAERNVTDAVVNIRDPKSFAFALEEELFKHWKQQLPDGTEGCGDKYKSKYRSIQFNLRDVNNSRLRSRILSGDVTANKLATFTSEELANEKVREMAEEARKQSIQQVIKVQTEDAATKKQQIELLGLATAEWKPTVAKADSQATLVNEPKKSVITKSMAPSKPFDLDEVISSINKSSQKAEARPAVSVVADEPPSAADIINTIALSATVSELSEKIHQQRSPKREAEDDAGNEEKKAKTEVSIGYVDASKYDFGFDEEGDYGMMKNTEPLPPSTPPYDPFQGEEEIGEQGETAWKGTVLMSQVGKFTGTCFQVAGKELELKQWEDILPTTLNVEGRVSSERVIPYLEQQLHSATKDIAVVQFHSEDTASYEALFKYFATRKKFAVVKSPYLSVKDLYLVPVAQSEDVPDFIKLLGHNKVLDQRPGNLLFGVAVIVRDYVGNISSSSSKPTKKRRPAPPSVPQPAAHSVQAQASAAPDVSSLLSNPQIQQLLASLQQPQNTMSV